MYCSTCGALVPPGRYQCDTCGTPLLRARTEAPTELAPGRRDGVHAPAVVLGTCRRCGYRGEGVGHFSKGSHMAVLVGFTLFTAGAMGAGGLVYYMMRRDHLICPRCGNGWGKHGVRALVRTERAGSPTSVPPTPSWGEGYRQGWAIALFILAALLAVVGIAATEAGPLVAAGLAAAGGLVVQRAAERDRERRRAAMIASLQLPVLQLAARHGGRLTVTEVAAELGWTIPRAEKVLQSLDDDVRVSSEVTDEGIIVYTFRELGRGARRPSELEG